MASLALGDFSWQAWHLVTSTFTLRGRHGAWLHGPSLSLAGVALTYGTGLALVARLGLAGAAALCVAGVVLGDIDLHFAWQAWHLVTSTFTLRGTWWDLHFASPALVARLVPVCRRGHRGCLRGRCGAWRC